MVDTEHGEADRQVVLLKYPDAFCTRPPGGKWQVLRVNPYVALSKKHGSVDAAWEEAAQNIAAIEGVEMKELYFRALGKVMVGGAKMVGVK